MGIPLSTGTIRLPVSASIPKKPNSLEFLLVSALKSISSSSPSPSPSLIPGGQQIHCYVIKAGLSSNIFLQNSLISMYSKSGLFSSAKSIFDNSQNLDSVSLNIMLGGYVKYGHLNDARDLFARMPLRNCVSYTTLIMGLAQAEYYWDAIELYWEMRFSGLVPGEAAMASVISSYAHVDDVRRRAVFLHGFLVKLGLNDSVLISTNLVLLYCASSHLDEARMVFDQIVVRNVVSWNVMLNGYVKAGLVVLARELFEEIPEKDVITWGTMIDGYVQVGRLMESLSIYTEMRQTGLHPNEVMVVDLISACGQGTKFIEGQQLHAMAVKAAFNCYDFVQATLVHFYAACGEVKLASSQFEEGNKDHIACWNTLIAGFMRNGLVEDSKRLFMEMPERDIFSWSSMISGYAQNGQHNLAIELFQEMVAQGIKPNEITMVSVFSAISSSSMLKEGRWAHDYIFSNSIPITDNLSAAIIDMYSKCGSIDSALEVFYQTREKAKDISPWNAIICGLAKHGHAEASLRIFSDLQSRSINPNSITFIGVLSSCCHAGLVEAGKEHFKSIKTVYNLEPNIKHYGCMVDLLGRAGLLKEAEELIQSMPMKADAVTWGTLLAACKMHGDTDIGERAAENLIKVEPSHGPGRILLSNIYAYAGRWNEASLARQAVQSGGFSRSPGYSGVV